MALETRRLLRFGSFRLDPEMRLLLRGEEPVALRPRVFDTLKLLAEKRGEVVSKEELLETVWPDTVVEENNLNQNILVLRRVFNANGGDGVRIETVPRRGYRLIAAPGEDDPSPAVALAPIEELPARTSGARGWPWLAGMAIAAVAVAMVIPGIGWIRGLRHPIRPIAGVRSIAVLPLKTLGAEGDDPLGLGLTDAVITRLGYVRSLRVRPTEAVAMLSSPGSDPVATGRALSVDSVLVGQIQRSGERVRVTVRLVGVHEGADLWTEKFDVRAADLFSIEDTISEAMVSALAASLSIADNERKQVGRDRPTTPQAYEAYLRGRYLWNRRGGRDLVAAAREFDASIAADPLFAPAWSASADAHVLLGPDERKEFALARKAAERALELDPTLAEAHASLAMALFFGEWDFAGAEREFKKATDLAPGYVTAHHWYAYWLVAVGRFDEAVAQMLIAREIDPTSLVVNRDVGHILLYARRYDEAAAELRETLRRDPSFPSARVLLIETLIASGKSAEASEELRSLPEGDATRRQFEAILEQQAGRPEKLRRLAAEKARSVESGAIHSDAMAAVYGPLGEKAEAFRWLERAFAERRFYLIFLKVDPAFDSIRGDSRFADLVRRVGLPP